MKRCLVLIVLLSLSWASTGFPQPKSAPGVPIVVTDGLMNIGGSTAGYRIAKNAIYVAASDAPDWAKSQADYVCDGADDEIEIQAAIDLLTTGGKVFLSGGTFTLEDDDADGRGVEITTSDVALEGIGPSTVITIVDSHDANMQMIVAEGGSIENVQIRNLQLDGNSANVGGTRTYTGIYVYDVTGAVIENVLAVDGGGAIGYAILIDEADGSIVRGLQKGTFYTNSLEIRGSDGVVIIGCTLEKALEFYSSTSNITVTGNTITGDNVNFFTYHEATTGTGVSFTNNVMKYDGSTVLQIRNANNVLISGNVFIAGDGDDYAINIAGGDVECSNVLITGNLIRGGLLSMRGDDTVFSNNLVIAPDSATAGSPVLTNSTALDGLVVRGNRFVGNSGNRTDVITFDAVTDGVIEGNTFSEFDNATDTCIELLNACTGTFIRHNVAENVSCTRMFAQTNFSAGVIVEDNWINGALSYVKSYYNDTGLDLRHSDFIRLSSGNDASDDTGTLADGQYNGQEVYIELMADLGDDWIVTITNHETSDPEVCTFDDAGDYLLLRWVYDEWKTLENTCTF